ncbi:MAG: hypothetical protein AAB581_02495, partial [Patescibacteria group bacterium]
IPSPPVHWVYPNQTQIESHCYQRRYAGHNPGSDTVGKNVADKSPKQACDKKDGYHNTPPTLFLNEPFDFAQGELLTQTSVREPISRTQEKVGEPPRVV